MPPVCLFTCLELTQPSAGSTLSVSNSTDFHAASTGMPPRNPATDEQRRMRPGPGAGVGPDLQHAADQVVHQPASMAEVHPERLVFDLAIAQADGGAQAATAHVVHKRD